MSQSLSDNTESWVYIGKLEIEVNSGCSTVEPDSPHILKSEVPGRLSLEQ